MTLAYLIAGVLLLLLGRKVLWLFLAAVGFVAGMGLAQRFFPEMADSTLMVVGLGMGALGAVLALVLQKVAVWVGGFIGGGYLAVALMHFMIQANGSTFWIVFLVGGVLGMMVAHFLLKWVLIILSSAIGAVVICTALDPDSLPGAVLFIVLMASGILIQSGFFARKAPSDKKE